MWHRIVVVGLTLGLVGCGKTRQCERFVQAVNADLEGIEQTYGTDVRARTPETFDDVTKRYKAMAAGITALEIRHPRIKKHVQEYVALAERTAVATERTAKALRDQKKRKRHWKRAVSSQKREIDRIRGQEKLLVARLNSVCKR